MRYLLDTNVLSELRKPAARIDPGVTGWASDQEPEDLFVSVVSIFELEIGVQRKERTDPDQGGRLRGGLECDVLDAFRKRTLDLDLRVVRRAAGLHVPDPRPNRDAVLAATADLRGLTVVTRNDRDFAPLGVRVLNPWSPGQP